MLTNKILQSAGTSSTELEAAVGRYRALTDPETLAHGHLFDVEAGASVIEQLTGRLAAIHSIIEPLLTEDGPQALLARAIAQEILPATSNATAVIARHLEHSVSGQSMILGEATVFGHPDMRLVTHGDLNHAEQVFVFTRFVVHTPTEQVFPVHPDESGIDAVERFAARLETAVNQLAA
jgi:ethanolamine utilization protein EutP (predicted NTPase)